MASRYGGVSALCRRDMTLRQAAKSDNPVTTPNGTCRPRVLVVDDNRVERRILNASLTRWGYQVDEAASGEEALAFCKKSPPDLIISDWMMPGMNGLDFCRAFRDLERDDYGYFILLTSKSETDSVARGLDSGADDFLTKPVNPDELRARLTAGERLLSMQTELRQKNHLLASTLAELQTVYDSIDSDLIEARKLQQSLVRDRFRDFETAQVSLTLSPAGHVGGDLVGFFPINDTCVGLYAIDVAGHGISSALMTARLAGYFSSAVPEQNVALARGKSGEFYALPTSEVAARLNQLVHEEVGVEHYFTLVLAICDLTTGTVRMTQAGHPHPMLQVKGGAVQEVGSGGLPIGLIPDAGFDEFEVTLTPGDRLLILSDGMVECPDENNDLVGEEGLKQILEHYAETKGNALLETLIWRLSEINPAPDFPDDISAILFEYRG